MSITIGLVKHTLEFSYKLKFHYSTILDLYIYGLVIVENVPLNLEGFQQMIGKISYPETCHYGHWWTVEQKKDPNNIAYTGAEIGLHQDLPFYEKMPSVGDNS